MERIHVVPKSWPIRAGDDLGFRILVESELLEGVRPYLLRVTNWQNENMGMGAAWSDDELRNEIRRLYAIAAEDLIHRRGLARK